MDNLKKKKKKLDDMFLLNIYGHVLIRGRAWSAGKADPAAQDRNHASPT